jgi:CubicO group peptidase (beta-lactamase class C family)
MKRKAFLPVFILLQFICSNVFAQSEKAETSIQAIMQQTNVVGISVAVVKNNKIILHHSFGYKELETKQPLTMIVFLELRLYPNLFLLLPSCNW